MKETIININEIHEDKEGASGYAITTNKQVIKLLIDNDQLCCESWGYFMSEDEFDSFIGADIMEISLTDTALNTTKFKKYDIDAEWFEGGVMFVNITTSKGLLQFVAYNEHKGWYGHDAYVISEQLNHTELL